MSQTTPLNIYQRVARQLEQSGRGQLTDRQNRRANKKFNQAERRERQQLARATPHAAGGDVTGPTTEETNR